MNKSIHSHCISTFSIPKTCLSQLSNYFILHWEGSYLEEQQKKSLGAIWREGIEYLVIYHHCLPRDCFSSPQCALSFRRMKEYSYGYVLISPITNICKIHKIDSLSKFGSLWINTPKGLDSLES